MGHTHTAGLGHGQSTTTATGVLETVAFFASVYLALACTCRCWQYHRTRLLYRQGPGRRSGDAARPGSGGLLDAQLRMRGEGGTLQENTLSAEELAHQEEADEDTFWDPPALRQGEVYASAAATLHAAAAGLGETKLAAVGCFDDMSTSAAKHNSSQTLVQTDASDVEGGFTPGVWRPGTVDCMRNKYAQRNGWSRTTAAAPPDSDDDI